MNDAMFAAFLSALFATCSCSLIGTGFSSLPMFSRILHFFADVMMTTVSGSRQKAIAVSANS